jgi:hypothetical protein
MERSKVVVALPHGFVSDGCSIREVELRQLNGYDERYISETRDLPSFIRATRILERVVTLGQTDCDIGETLRKLTIGDRIDLLLHLRMLTFDDMLPCVLVCQACSESMSLDLSISGLLEQSEIPQSPSGEYALNIDNLFLRLRPVTGGDQELLFYSDSIPDDNHNNNSQYKNNRAEQLVRSCVISCYPPLSDELSEVFISTLSSKLDEIDPHADLDLEFRCPSCQDHSKVAFDVEEYIFHELDSLQEQLEREVHWIAFNYHWSEDAILSLTVRKRKKYVGLINKTLLGEGV